MFGAGCLPESLQKVRQLACLGEGDFNRDNVKCRKIMAHECPLCRVPGVDVRRSLSKDVHYVRQGK